MTALTTHSTLAQGRVGFREGDGGGGGGLGQEGGVVWCIWGGADVQSGR